MGGRSFHKSDAPYPIPNDVPEWQRLDDMHNGIKGFLENRLSFAEIDTAPKKILEIGAGSGAWAIQAANTYPDAEVVAVDISPLPPRPLPENIKFRMIDVTQPLPFEPSSFDLLHIRFVLIHLPNFRNVLAQLVKVLKPGGWLLIEDIDHHMHGDIGPGIKKFYEVYHGYMSTRNVDPEAGILVEHILKESGQFSEVYMRKVGAAFSGGNGDPALDHLGQVLKVSFCRVYEAFEPQLVSAGMTEEVKEGWYQEIDDPKRTIRAELYFTWARKA